MKPEKILSENNGYGGKTVEIEFEHGDNKFNEGIFKIIQFYNSDGKVVKGEVYFDEENPNSNDMKLIIKELDEDGRETKAFVHYTDEYTKNTGIHYSIYHYDKKGREREIDQYYVDSGACVYKNNTIYLDEDGNIVKTETRFSDFIADSTGSELIIQEYGKDLKLKITEMHIDEKHQKMSGIVKFICYYDEEGKGKEKEWYYTDGRVEREPWTDDDKTVEDDSLMVRELKIEPIPKGIDG